MRAAYFEQAGPAATVLRVAEVPTPVAGPGEVRVRLRTSGVNPSDVKRRAAGQPEFARVIVHSDGAGTIDQVGDGVPRSRVGERVWVMNAQYKRAMGTAAEYVVLPANLAFALPDGVDDGVGACIGIPIVTAYHGIELCGDISGATVLVAGGAGAVGHYVVQLAKRAGATVIATVSSPEKASHARAGGADHTIDYRREDVGERVAALTGGRGVDRMVEVDLAANAHLISRVMRPGGAVVVYGSGGAEAAVPATFCIRNSISLLFYIVYELPPAVRSAEAAAVNELLAADALVHAVAERHPLDAIVAAHEAVESGRVIGNVVVDIA
jgi:NADPH2:quinone reductase